MKMHPRAAQFRTGPRGLRRRLSRNDLEAPMRDAGGSPRRSPTVVEEAKSREVLQSQIREEVAAKAGGEAPRQPALLLLRSSRIRTEVHTNADGCER